jgi:hypothetical protein
MKEFTRVEERDCVPGGDRAAWQQLTPEQIAEYHEHGYLLMNNYFSAAEIEVLFVPSSPRTPATKCSGL